MNKAIVVHQTGGPEVLVYEEHQIAPPAKGEAQIRHEAVGVNFLDVYHRIGLYPLPLPLVPGSEGAGVVTAVGEGVNFLKPGDRVTYAGVLGSYSQTRNLPASRLIPVPDTVPLDVAAAATLKGLTTCYLLEMTANLKPGDTIVFHSAAGGVGQIAVQWAKSMGVKVIGTVGSEEKAEIARSLGCDHVIDTRANPDFAPKVRELTEGKGVAVVFDSVGKVTFEASLDCLRPRGLMVSFGNSSGPVSVPSLGILSSKGSLYVTRPTLGHYFPDRAAEIAGAEKLWAKIRDGVVKIAIGQRFPLAEAKQAHIALEGRKTTGSTVLIP